jgi:hypothetical protein
VNCCCGVVDYPAKCRPPYHHIPVFRPCTEAEAPCHGTGECLGAGPAWLGCGLVRHDAGFWPRLWLWLWRTAHTHGACAPPRQLWRWRRGQRGQTWKKRASDPRICQAARQCASRLGCLWGTSLALVGRGSFAVSLLYSTAQAACQSWFAPFRRQLAGRRSRLVMEWSSQPFPHLHIRASRLLLHPRRSSRRARWRPGEQKRRWQLWSRSVALQGTKVSL